MQTLVKWIFAAAMLLAPISANAQVEWVVTGTFNDGTALSGTFHVNQYGFLDDANLSTDPKGAFAGFNYLNGAAYPGNGNSYGGLLTPEVLDLEPNYQGALHLTFVHDVNVPSRGNFILGGPRSYECQGGYSCGSNVGDVTRYLVSGSAFSPGAAPEAATWAMMIGGLGLAGFGLRRRRRGLLLA